MLKNTTETMLLTNLNAHKNVVKYDKLDDRPKWRRQAVIYETFASVSGRCTHATVLLP